MIGATLQQGTVTASLRLRKLGSYLHHNGMAMALRELGSIERTLFILDWLQSIELRRRIQARLNKDEARNEHQYRPAVIEMAAGDTTVGFTPTRWRLRIRNLNPLGSIGRSALNLPAPILALLRQR